jgi:type IX secretion system substrate protein
MKKIRFIVFVFICCSSIAQAQAPWYRYLGANPKGPSADELCSVYEIKQNPVSGTIWVLSESPSDMMVFNVDSAGSSSFGWSHFTYPTLGSLHADADLTVLSNSDVIVSGWRYQSNGNISFMNRYATNGNSVWGYVLNENYGYIIKSTCMNYTGDTLLVFVDGFQKKYSYDPLTGAVLDSMPFATSGSDLMELSNHDFMLKGTSSVNRVNITGASVWSHPATVSDYNTSSVVVTNAVGEVSLLDINTGSPLWTTPTGISGIANLNIRSNGSIVGVTSDTANLVPHQMFYLDPSGSLQWTKTYNAGLFGFDNISEANDGGILVGGTYFQSLHDAWYQSTLHDFNNTHGSFVLHADSLGNGPEKISNMWTGDVNHDGIIDINDGLFLGVAMNAIGLARNSMGIEPAVNSYGDMRPSVDWGQNFTNGSDYKSADGSGDGVVDVADAQYISFWGSTHPNWRGSPEPDATSNPACCISIVPSTDTVYAGQSFSVYLIVGSPGSTIDSIYVAHMNIYSNSSTAVIDINQSEFVPYPGSFGSPGLNTMTYKNGSPVVLSPGYEYYVTRLNQQNALQFYDTIAVFNLVANNVIVPEAFDLQLQSSTAMTYYEDIFGLTIGQPSADVVIMPVITGLTEQITNEVNVYPNPSDGIFNLDKSLVDRLIKVYDLKGVLVSEKKLRAGDTKLDLTHLESGSYVMKVGNSTNTASPARISIMR